MAAQVGFPSLQVTRYSYGCLGIPMAIPMVFLIAIPQSYVRGTHEWGPRYTEAALFYTWAGIPVAALVFVWPPWYSYRLFLYLCLGSEPV